LIALNSLGVQIEDTLPPNVLSHSLNNGNASTDNYTVNLQFEVQDTNTAVEAYYFSESNNPPSVNDSRWQMIAPLSNYQNSLTYSFEPSAIGTKSLYLWFRDIAGNISNEIL